MTRGCIENLPSAEAEVCRKNSEICKSCNGGKCNLKPKFQECLSCNSKMDPECARVPQLVKTRVCTLYESICLTGIDKIGFIHRRCGHLNSNSQIEFPKYYKTCNEDKCNDKISPENALKCHQCYGKKECDMTNITLLKPQPCTVYSKYNQCYTYINQG